MMYLNKWQVKNVMKILKNQSRQRQEFEDLRFYTEKWRLFILQNSNMTC